MSEIPTTEMERQMRILMNIAVGEPPRRVSAEAVRRRAIRRRAAAYAAVAVVLFGGGVGGAFAAQRTGLGPKRGNSPVAVGQPRYYVARSLTKTGAETAVRATATGAVTGKVRCPAFAASVTQGPVAPAAHETFFLVCEKVTAQGLPTVVSESRIYRFAITRSGGVGGYALVRGGTLTGLRASDLAVTPDGSELAVTVTQGTADPSAAQPPEVIVIDSRAGTHAVWHGAAPVPGKIFYPVYDLSLTADSKELAFLSQPRCVKGKNAPKCHVNGGEEVRAVSDPASGGQLSGARLLVRQSELMRLSVGFINDAVISPDGRTVILAEVAWPLDYISIARASTATGKQVGVLFRTRTGNGFSYQFFSSDPSRRFFLLDAGPSSRLINGWIYRGRLTRLRPAGANVIFEAW